MSAKLLQPGEMSEGVRMLLAVGARQEDIAKRVKCSRSLIAQILTRRRKPSIELRPAFKRLWKIPHAAWDQPATVVEPPPAPEEDDDDDDRPLDDSESTLFAARAKQLGRQYDMLLRESDAHPDRRDKNGKAAALILSQLGRMTGETQLVSESKIIRYPAWRRLMQRLSAALEPWPDAMLAVGRELEKLGSETPE